MTSSTWAENSRPYDVVILGAGYAGLMAALRLSRQKYGLRMALVNARENFLERVRLQETIVAPVSPRIPSLSALFAGTSIEFICGNVISLDAEQRRVRISIGAHKRDIAFIQVIYALGSHVDVDSVPGVAEHTYRLDPGDGPRSAAALRLKLWQNLTNPLRVVAVGGGPTAIEASGEIKSTWPGIEMTMVSQRCGDFAGKHVEEAARGELGRLGVKLIDGEIVSAVGPSELTTRAGRSIAYDVCVWSGGMRSPPIAGAGGLATDPDGRIWVDPNLRSISHSHILAVGDSAHPIAATGAPYRRSALAAGASGGHAASVVLAQQAKRELQPFSFTTIAQAVAIGRLGVIYLLDSDDRQIGSILRGRAARKLRDFFLLFVANGFKLERRIPGSFFLPGANRVSWADADDAMQQFRVVHQT
jgi:NADH dehydrogenase